MWAVSGIVESNYYCSLPNRSFSDVSSESFLCVLRRWKALSLTFPVLVRGVQVLHAPRLDCFVFCNVDVLWVYTSHNPKHSEHFWNSRTVFFKVDEQSYILTLDSSEIIIVFFRYDFVFVYCL